MKDTVMKILKYILLIVKYLVQTINFQILKTIMTLILFMKQAQTEIVHPPLFNNTGWVPMNTLCP